MPEQDIDNAPPPENDESMNKSNAPLATLLRLTGEAKVEAAKDFLKLLIENKCKFLLFAHHKSVLDLYE